LKLTDNFQLEEFLRDNIPTVAETERLKLLCEALMQPIRNKFGKIDILSGLRSTEVNQLVGGAINSDHLYGAACDFSSHIVILRPIYDWIIDAKLHYRQLIYYPDKNFIHISINYPGKSYKNGAWIHE
jgi:uncharacterized protein YcbK (DUF882 family)